MPNKHKLHIPNIGNESLCGKKIPQERLIREVVSHHFWHFPNDLPEDRRCKSCDRVMWGMPPGIRRPYLGARHYSIR